MPLVFEVIFLMAIILQIESTVSAGGGGWGSVDGLKQTFKHKQQARSAIRISLATHTVIIDAPQTQTIKCTLMVLQHCKKVLCKSRPGHLVSSAWCLWIVHSVTFIYRQKWISIFVTKRLVFQCIC